ncbi:hypothetical protein ACQJBY_039987 [Aegilops geniculata]
MGANQSALPAAPAIQDDDAPPATPIPMNQPPEPWVVPAGPPVFRVPAPPVPPPREPEVFPDFPPVINRVGNGWVADPPNPCLLSLKYVGSPWYLMESSKPASLIVKSWRCASCKKLFKSSYNLFVNIPPPRCDDCLTENQASYCWTMTRVIFNTIRVDFPVLYQQRGDLCVIYAFMALVDLLRTLRGSQNGWLEPANLCSFGIEAVYKDVHGVKIGQEKSYYDRRFGRMENLFACMCLRGVPLVATKFNFHRPDLPRHSLRLKCWFRITIEDTDTIVRLLANGVPLMGALRMGALFEYLKAMQIYYALGPYKGLWAHVVVLHGSGFASPKGTYYTCRNSYGYKVHGYSEKKDTGGDFNIWSSDLYGFVYGCELA